MGIFDALSGAIGDAIRKGGTASGVGDPNAASQSAFPGSFSEILANTNFGNLSGLVQKLSEGGLGEQVSSWLGAGANLPISGEELRSALGNQEVQKIAQQLGLPTDRILDLLSQHLPEAVDKASPNGQIQEPPQTAH